MLCLIGTAFAIRLDKKINLEDIERDNLKSEHKVKQEKQETKTLTSTTYIEQQQEQEVQATPQVSYIQPQPSTVQQAPPQTTYIQQVPPQATYIQQAPPQTTYIQQAPPQTTYIQQAPRQYSFQPVKTAQSYLQSIAPQFINRLSQYEVPLVSDNSIAQPNYYSQQQQQQQQYVYLQPAAAASQVAPRAVQYVMYIPASVAAAATSPATAYSASPKTETLLQSAQEYLNSLPLPQAYTTQEYTYDVAAPPQRYVMIIK